MAGSLKKGRWYKRSGRSVYQIVTMTPGSKGSENVAMGPNNKYFAYDSKGARFAIKYPSIGMSRRQVESIITDKQIREIGKRVKTNVKKKFLYGVEVTRMQNFQHLVNRYQAWHMFARNQAVIYPKGGFGRTKEGRSRLASIRDIFMGHDADVFQTLSRGGTVKGVKKWKKLSMWTAFCSRVHESAAAPAGPGFRSIKAYARAQMPLRDTNRLFRAIGGIGTPKDWSATWKRMNGRNGGLEIINKVPYAKKMAKGGVGKFITSQTALDRLKERIAPPKNTGKKRPWQMSPFEKIMAQKEKDAKKNTPVKSKKGDRKEYWAKRRRKLKGGQNTGITPIAKARPYYQLRSTLIMQPVRTKRIPRRNWQTKQLTAEAQAKISRLVEGSIKEFDRSVMKGLGHIYGEMPISAAAANQGNRRGGIGGDLEQRKM